MNRITLAAILAATLATTPAHAIEGRTGVFGGWANSIGSFFSRNASSQGPSRESGYVSGMRSLDRMYREGRISRATYERQMATYARKEREARNDPAGLGRSAAQQRRDDK